MNKRRMEDKKCETCGILIKAENKFPCRFKKQRFCSVSCSKIGERNNNWEGNMARVTTANARATLRFKLRICDKCHKTMGFDRHHIDGNVFNNNLDNIMVLCRTCHVAIDGRYEKFLKMPHLQLERDRSGRFLCKNV